MFAFNLRQLTRVLRTAACLPRRYILLQSGFGYVAHIPSVPSEYSLEVMALHLRSWGQLSHSSSDAIASSGRSRMQDQLKSPCLLFAWSCTEWEVSPLKLHAVTTALPSYPIPPRRRRQGVSSSGELEHSGPRAPSGGKRKRGGRKRKQVKRESSSEERHADSEGTTSESSNGDDEDEPLAAVAAASSKVKKEQRPLRLPTRHGRSLSALLKAAANMSPVQPRAAVASSSAAASSTPRSRRSLNMSTAASHPVIAHAVEPESTNTALTPTVATAVTATSSEVAPSSSGSIWAQRYDLLPAPSLAAPTQAPAHKKKKVKLESDSLAPPKPSKSKTSRGKAKKSAAPTMAVMSYFPPPPPLNSTELAQYAPLESHMETAMRDSVPAFSTLPPLPSLTSMDPHSPQPASSFSTPFQLNMHDSTSHWIGGGSMFGGGGGLGQMSGLLPGLSLNGTNGWNNAVVADRGSTSPPRHFAPAAACASSAVMRCDEPNSFLDHLDSHRHLQAGRYSPLSQASDTMHSPQPAITPTLQSHSSSAIHAEQLRAADSLLLASPPPPAVSSSIMPATTAVGTSAVHSSSF
jgi:hypothetical protein